jgi:hypothetical protein
VERQTVQEPLKILPDSIPLTLANNYLKQYFPTLKTSQMRTSTVYKPMRFFFLPLLLIIASQAFAVEPVLKFTMTKAAGTPTTYEFLLPDNDPNQGVPFARDEAVQQQHNAGVAALTWAKQFYGAHEIFLRSVELQQGPIPYYLAKFDGELAGARQVFFAIVLTSGSVLEPVEMH